MSSKGILPTLIEDLKGFKVDTIRCGYKHSYVRTKCGKHYLFGSNLYNECLQFGKYPEYVPWPYRVDQIIQNKCNAILKDVYPGDKCTTCIVSIST